MQLADYKVRVLDNGARHRGARARADRIDRRQAPLGHGRTCRATWSRRAGRRWSIRSSTSCTRTRPSRAPSRIRRKPTARGRASALRCATARRRGRSRMAPRAQPARRRGRGADRRRQPDARGHPGGLRPRPGRAHHARSGARLSGPARNLDVSRGALAVGASALTLLGRLLSELSRWLTGIEIHPGATVGRRLFHRSRDGRGDRRNRGNRRRRAHLPGRHARRHQPQERKSAIRRSKIT